MNQINFTKPHELLTEACTDDKETRVWHLTLHLIILCVILVISGMIQFLRYRRKNYNIKVNFAFHINDNIVCTKNPKTNKKTPPNNSYASCYFFLFKASDMFFFVSAVGKNEVIMVTIIHARSFPAHPVEGNKTVKFMGGSEIHLWFCSNRWHRHPFAS